MKKTRILTLDLSSSTGSAVLEYTKSSKIPKLVHYGTDKVGIEDFNVNNFPNQSPKYPTNIIETAQGMALCVKSIVEIYEPDYIIIENTVKGRNRHTQRLLEWIHLLVLLELDMSKVIYMDPSEWRKALNMRLSPEDKKHNQLVSKKKARGKITKKHLSVRLVNDTMGLELKLKDNDIADAVCLGLAYWGIHGRK